MSGGQLVVLDRLGRDVKRFPLAEGLVTLGSDHFSDIRFLSDTVHPHHATVAVHANQTVVRNVCEDETLVNGRPVSVAALRHGDVIGIGGRQLRWDYADPSARRVQAPQPALYVARRKTRVARRKSGPATTRRDPAVRLAIEMSHRASMPANAGGKQVAIVQPQRRDTNDQNDKPAPRTPLQANIRPRSSKNDIDVSITDTEAEKAKRKSSPRGSPKASVTNLQNTTKATLWIESRKSSPRKSVKMQTPTQNVINIRRNAMSAKKSTPLRLTVLKRAQSAQKMKVTKIEAPLKIDHTKQAAILLMTGHTAKSKLVSQKTSSPKSSTPQLVTAKSASPKSVTPKAATPKSVTPKSGARKTVSPKSSGRRSASFVVKKKSPVRRSTPRGGKSRVSAVTASPQDRTVTILEITDSDGRNSTLRSTRRSGQKSLEKSPVLLSPKKSALKNPLAKKSMRKTESIKFDLSNLENYSQEESDVLMVTDTTRQTEGDSTSEDDISLHYSESSVQSPSPRRSIHSRSSKILEKTLGTTMTISPPSRTLTPESPRPRKSLRGSLIVQNALDKSDNTLSYSRRTTKSVSDVSESTVASAFRTRTLSPRTPQNNMESYSIVDLVSIDSNESGRSTSVYNSAGSTSNAAFGTPQNSSARTTRSTINADLLGSSTPYVKGSRSSTPRSQSSPNTSSKTSNNSSRMTNKSSVSVRKTKSVSTPENSTKHVSVNSTRISRASRSRSRLNDSDLVLLETNEADDSPRSSKRASTVSKRSSSAPQISRLSKNETPTASPSESKGISTPENRHSPEEASTPVLNIQSLLDSSQNSIASQTSKRRGRTSFKRKTIGVITGPKTRISAKSKSMNFSARKTRLRLSNDSYENMNLSGQQDEEMVTPKSAVKLVQEDVKNKHSTAKKPQSKRSIIDDLNESDIVKQLFNSPVKRKLSQSMTEFSKKQLFDDDDIVQVRRPTRNTVALSGRTPDDSLLDHTEAITPERFVSPISTPSHSPNLDGIKLLFGKKTPEDDLRNVRGVKGLLRTPRARKSIRNDLTDVTGVKAVFAKSPRNRLTDVRVKEVFASSPKNDLSRVSAVKSLFHIEKQRKSPRNSLGDVRGVKKLFNRKSPVNDLRNVSGVKKTLQRKSPKNDLRDVRGVRRMFRQDKPRNELNDVSGVEELFNESNQSHRDAESLFDQLVGKPVIKAVYSKTFSSRSAPKKNTRSRKSIHASLDFITNNVEQWLEQELKKRLHKDQQPSTDKSANNSNLNMTRELQKLATDTVDGLAPIRTSRVRNSTINNGDGSKTGSNRASLIDESKKQKSASELYSAHTLPIKKRYLVDTSVERVKNDSKPIDLPIKKRAVVHSTPVKGRQVNMTMNASELGRVSPIVAEKTQDLEQEPRSNFRKESIEVRPKSRRGTKASPKSIIITKPSPKNTRGKSRVSTPTKAKPATPTKAKPVTPTKPKPATPTKSKSATPTKSKPATPKKVKPATPTKEKSPAKTKTPSPAKKQVSLVVIKVVSPKTTRSRRTIIAMPQADTNTKKRSVTVVQEKSPVKTEKASPVKTKKPSPVKTKKSSPVKKPVSLSVTKPVSPKTTRSRRAIIADPQTDTNTKKRSIIVVKEKSPVKTKMTSPAKKPISPQVDTKAKKRGATLVVTKKGPVMSPQPKASRGRKDPETVQIPEASPKKTRATRNKDEKVVEKPKTPKNTRAKVRKTTVVVSKPSPQIKPRSTRGKAQVSVTETSTVTHKAEPKKKVAAKKVESPKKSPVQRKSVKDVTTENILKTRGRKTAVTKDESKQMSADVEQAKPKTRRGRNTTVEEPSVARKTRKTEKQTPVEVEPKTKTKTTNKQEQNVEETKRTRGKKAVSQESVQSEPTTRSRRAAKLVNTVIPEVTTRKRKSTATDDRPTKISKGKEAGDTRGRSKKVESPKTETVNFSKRSTAKGNTNKKQASGDAPKKATRSRKADVSVEATKEPAKRPARGRKAPVVEPAPELGKRKRKTAVETLAVEDTRKRSRAGNKAPAPVTSPARARPTRSAAAPAGRSRRR